MKLFILGTKEYKDVEFCTFQENENQAVICDQDGCYEKACIILFRSYKLYREVK